MATPAGLEPATIGLEGQDQIPDFCGIAALAIVNGIPKIIEKSRPDVNRFMPYPRLSDYPSPKVRLSCEKCGLAVQYDRDALIKAGGDRELIDFRLEVARRNGCTKTKIDPKSVFDRCGIVYPDLVKMGP